MTGVGELGGVNLNLSCGEGTEAAPSALREELWVLRRRRRPGVPFWSDTSESAAAVEASEKPAEDLGLETGAELHSLAA